MVRLLLRWGVENKSYNKQGSTHTLMSQNTKLKVKLRSLQLYMGGSSHLTLCRYSEVTGRRLGGIEHLE